MESCDEAEKEVIYKSAYKTYVILNKVIPVLLLLTRSLFILDTGIMGRFIIDGSSSI